MKILPQVMSTFIAIGVAFLLAYYTYLSAVRSNLEEKIEEESFKIVARFKEVYISNSFAGFGKNIIIKYLNRKPTISRIKALEEITSDLDQIPINRGLAERYMLKDFSADKGFSGRLYVFLLNDYLNVLFKHGFSAWQRFPFDIEIFDKKEKSKYFFPYGPLGVDEWLNNYRRIWSAYGSIYTFESFYITNLREYIDSVDNDQLKTSFTNLYSDKYFEKYKNNLIEINKSVQRIESLIRLKSINSFENKLPSWRWIVFLSACALFFGVIIPICFEVYNNNHLAPLIVRSIIMLVSFILLIGTLLLMINDLRAKETYKEVEKYITLENYFQTLSGEIKSSTYINYINLNDIVSEKLTINKNNRLFNKIKSIRDDIVEVNACSIDIVEKFYKLIIKDPLISQQKKEKNESGYVVDIIELLKDEIKTNSFNLDTSFELYFNIWHEQKKRSIIIKTPKTDSDYGKFIETLEKLRFDLTREKNVGDCLEKRKGLLVKAKEILNEVRQIENN